jgi:hypothetical protein
MRNDLDRYEIHYADRLWKLLPEVYRSVDSGNLDGKGPLRELCERIGAQMAIVRRSIDRTWEDQSIESGDDWMVPYLADLLATNLVSGSSQPEQRREVAKTIYYRRRKGTVALLEELAGDVTGWEVRIVEFFRRMARTRHGLDPAIGLPSATSDPAGASRLQIAEGLVGRNTRTVIGGTADLRNVYGASKAGSAFDEFFYTADSRRGRGRTGWHNIPRLGVFVWRLMTFPQSAGDTSTVVTPVAGVAPNLGCHSFDPTGRDVPLFAAGGRLRDAGFGDRWTSPAEWQLPTPIAGPLLDDDRRAGKSHPDLYAGPASPTAVEMRSLAVFDNSFAPAHLVPLASLHIRPEVGRFSATGVAGPFRVWSHYGFSARLGAGAYDRRPLAAALPAPSPLLTVHDGSGNLSAIPGSGTVTMGDSLTYDDVPDVTGVGDLTVRSANGTRPLIRPPATRAPWTFTAAVTTGATLRLEGIFTSGVDLVLRGRFDAVTVRFSTFDPGQAAASGWARAIDDRELVPATFWIEGEVGALTVERCITGPIRTRLGGSVETLTIRDSIVQFGAPAAGHALEVDSGEVVLVRSTILGTLAVHRLDASESILGDVATTGDPQHGCVRFSAWADGSILPRKYESVRIAAGAELFTSRLFGQPGYAQLRTDADTAILPTIVPGGDPATR